MPFDHSTVAQKYCLYDESFSALMHGNFSDGRLCVLEVCAERDSPVTSGVR